MTRCVLAFSLLSLVACDTATPLAPTPPGANAAPSVIGLWYADWQEVACEGSMDFRSACQTTDLRSALIPGSALPYAVSLDIERQEGNAIHGRVFLFNAHAVTPFEGELVGDVIRLSTTSVYSDGEVDAVADIELTPFGLGSIRLVFRSKTTEGQLEMTGQTGAFDRCDC